MILKEARTSARLSEAMMASMVGVTEDSLRELEAGAATPGPHELEAYAQVFGVRMDELALGAAAHAPMTNLLFRSSTTDVGLEGLKRLIASDAHRTIGEFMRCVRDVADLRAMLGGRSAVSKTA